MGREEKTAPAIPEHMTIVSASLATLIENVDGQMARLRILHTDLVAANERLMHGSNGHGTTDTNLIGDASTGPAPTPISTGKRRMSGRKATSGGTQANSGLIGGAHTGGAGKKRVISAAGRKAISKATKARWAKYHAEQRAAGKTMTARA